MSEKVVPFYQVVDGVRLPGFFSVDVFRSGLYYKPRSDDFFVSGYPKSGTTWVQQIVSIIFNRGLPPKSFLELNACSPFLEMTGAEAIEKMKRPGSIKTHLPFNRVPYSQEAKYLHVVRNPKDVVVSFYHHTHCDLYQFENGDFGVYFDLFLNGKTDLGDWFDNVLSWYEHRNDANVLYITYEQLKRDTQNVVKRIAKFMGQEYVDMLEDQKLLENVLNCSSLGFMKSALNESILDGDGNSDVLEVPEGFKQFEKYKAGLNRQNAKPFELIRKGLVGDWRSIFTEEQNILMNKKIEDKLGGTEIYSFWKSIGCI